MSIINSWLDTLSGLNLKKGMNFVLLLVQLRNSANSEHLSEMVPVKTRETLNAHAVLLGWELQAISTPNPPWPPLPAAF